MKKGTQGIQRRERAGKNVRTGVPGIAYLVTAGHSRRGLAQRFFSVSAKSPAGRRQNRHFSITSLGKEEAWRRALAFRAAYEAQLSLSQPQ